MKNVDITCSNGTTTTVNDIQEICVYLNGDLSQTYTMDNFSTFVTLEGYSYAFVGSSEVFSVAGIKIDNVYFYESTEFDI